MNNNSDEDEVDLEITNEKLKKLESSLVDIFLEADVSTHLMKSISLSLLAKATAFEIISETSDPTKRDLLILEEGDFLKRAMIRALTHLLKK